LKSWLRKFVLASGTISLLGIGPAAAEPESAKPAVVLVDAGDLPRWREWTSQNGWRVIAPEAATAGNVDTRVQGLEAAVRAAIQDGSADASRIYLTGSGGAAAAVFYAISRVPDLWAAALALGGSPQPAIDTDRLFTANFTNVPVLWISAGPPDEALAGKLKAAGMNLEWKNGSGNIEVQILLDWLAGHTREEHPGSIDCETNSPTFARCYWIRMSKFDMAERNDVLPSSRVQPNPGAALDLGGFNYPLDDPGPGVLVASLHDKYSGPLKQGDRIVALDGREIAGAREFTELMAQIKEERAAAVLVQRGKSRTRIETRVILPKRAPVVTARVQAQYVPADQEIQIVSRAVTEMRVTVPRQWLPAVINWNGVPLEKLETPGCRLLTIEKALEHAAACPER
jgi:predicted esterase